MIRLLPSFPASSLHQFFTIPLFTLYFPECELLANLFLPLVFTCAAFSVWNALPWVAFYKLRHEMLSLRILGSVPLLWANTRCPLLSQHLSPCLEIVCLHVYGFHCLHSSLLSSRTHCHEVTSFPLRAGTASFISAAYLLMQSLGCS